MSGEAAAAEPGAFAIGDLALGRALDEALVLTRRHGWPAALVGIVPLLPFTISVDLGQRWLERHGLVDPFLRPMLIDWPWESLFGGLIGVPLEAGMVYLFAMAYLGTPRATRDGCRHALRCWLRVAPIYVLLIAMAFAGIMMCILPGILLITAIYLHLPVMALEGAGPFAAFGRAFALMRGRVAVIVLIVCATITLGASMNTIATAFGPAYISAAAYRLLLAPVDLYLTALSVVLYFSARSRHESIDLQILADDIAAEGEQSFSVRL